jgi:hypothetical protein
MQVEVADFVEYLHLKRARLQLDASADKSLGPAIKQDPGSETPRHSLLDVLTHAPGHLAFQSVDEIDAHIRAERDTWDD